MLWESDVGRLIERTSYKFSNALLHQYGGTKYISVSESTSISKVADIGVIVSSDPEDEIIKGRQSMKGETTAVLSVSQYFSCMSCKAKVNKINKTLGNCLKCDATVKLSKCTNNSSAKIVVEDINHTNLTLQTSLMSLKL